MVRVLSSGVFKVCSGLWSRQVEAFLAPKEVKGFMVHHHVYYEAKLEIFWVFPSLFYFYRLRECSKSDFALS